ncbi:tRNA guanosine(34) transglycosylase Tgt [Planctomycetota bacterium]|jgi:queuine tRNA-ribosyltransferase|nr:tRNA guanosine(34) transglycosylase Tgt [Planctomycetota bacterium]
MTSPSAATTPSSELPSSSQGGFAYQVEATSPGDPGARRARVGRFSTPHGDVATPAFMPVGTRGTIKGVLPRDIGEVGSTMILANTLHLHLRPGEDTVAALGGLHRFMSWDGPILTDSGGYQVFSMADISTLDDDGVTFKSIVDGDRIRLTPERAIQIQQRLGPDVYMAFDHCPADPGDRRLVTEATDRTHRWLDRCVEVYRQAGGAEGSGQALFGIVQGGAFEDIRRASVDAVASHGLVGNAIGGVSVGEDRDAMRVAVEAAAPALPADRPRYLMGVGTPRDFFDAIAAGIDLFDCVTPTRHGRTHQVWTSRGRVNLRNAGWKNVDAPLDPVFRAPHVADVPVGVLRHLCLSNEMLGATYLSLHNLHLFHELMRLIREAIPKGELSALRDHWVPRLERRLTPDQFLAGDF